MDFELFETLAAMGEAMVFVTDLEANESTWVNQRLVDLTGYTLEDYRFKRFENPFIPDEDIAHVAEFTGAFLHSEVKVSGEVKNRFVDRWGGTLHVRSRMAKITWEGRPALLYWTVLDDPEHDHVERAEQRYRSLIETATDSIVRLRRNLTFSYSNRVLQDLLGYGPVELKERTLTSLMETPYREKFEAAASQSESRFLFSMPVRTHEGKRVWLDGTFVRIADGPDAGMWQATLRDTTEKRRMDARVQQAQRLEGLGQMAGGIAHDMNNILTGVSSAVGLTRDLLAEGKPVSSYLESISEGVRRAGQLSSSILSYAGEGNAERIPLDLAQVVEETRPLLQAAASQDSAVDFVSHDVPVVIEGDELQIRQVVMNLVTNAAEAAFSSGGSRVEVRVDECKGADVPWEGSVKQGDTLPPGQRVARIRVTDDGGGMTPDVLERVFDPFFSTKSKGRGLGLAAVQGIVRRHEGCVLARSSLGQGTEVTVLLPLTEDRLTQVLRRGSLAPGAGTILFVDDEAPIRRIARRTLEKHGYVVLEARDGEEAVELMDHRGAEVRAIVLDQTMPGMNGQETLRCIRESFPEVPILRTSGYSADQSQRSERTAFLGKPFQNQDLLQALQELLTADGD